MQHMPRPLHSQHGAWEGSCKQLQQPALDTSRRCRHHAGETTPLHSLALLASNKTRAPPSSALMTDQYSTLCSLASPYTATHRVHAAIAACAAVLPAQLKLLWLLASGGGWDMTSIRCMSKGTRSQDTYKQTISQHSMHGSDACSPPHMPTSLCVNGHVGRHSCIHAQTAAEGCGPPHNKPQRLHRGCACLCTINFIPVQHYSRHTNTHTHR